jgi:hypothetical protein
MNANFLLQNRDDQVLDYYLRLLAQKQLELESKQVEIEKRYKSSEDNLKKLQKKLDDANNEIQQLKQKPAAVIKAPKETKIEVGNFIINNNGTAIDKVNGLMWCRFAVGQEWDFKEKFIGKPERVTWFEAQRYKNLFNQIEFCGFRNWRIPTKNEFNSILNNSLSVVFPVLPKDTFWTADTCHTYDSSCQNVINLKNNSNRPLHNSNFSYVLFVRLNK